MVWTDVICKKSCEFPREKNYVIYVKVQYFNSFLYLCLLQFIGATDYNVERIIFQQNKYFRDKCHICANIKKCSVIQCILVERLKYLHEIVNENFIITIYFVLKNKTYSNLTHSDWLWPWYSISSFLHLIYSSINPDESF